MLTDSEKKWLWEREKLGKDGWGYLCAHCENKTDEYHSCYLEVMGGFCPTDSWSQNFVDAAEFEARVAAKLAEREHPVPCRSGKCCHPIPYARLCPACSLKHARLAVEAEMEENHE